jgi:phosphatidylglycerophosphatase A
VVLIAVVAIAGQVCSQPFITTEVRDPDLIVIDEVAGVWLALLSTPLTAPVCAAGAVTFRLIDKLKPGPVGVVDRTESRWSVMGDDLVAGLLTNVTLHAALAVIGAFS